MSSPRFPTDGHKIWSQQWPTRIKFLTPALGTPILSAPARQEDAGRIPRRPAPPPSHVSAPPAGPDARLRPASTRSRARPPTKGRLERPLRRPLYGAPHHAHTHSAGAAGPQLPRAEAGARRGARTPGAPAGARMDRDAAAAAHDTAAATAAATRINSGGGGEGDGEEEGRGDDEVAGAQPPNRAHRQGRLKFARARSRGRTPRSGRHRAPHYTTTTDGAVATAAGAGRATAAVPTSGGVRAERTARERHRRRLGWPSSRGVQPWDQALARHLPALAPHFRNPGACPKGDKSQGLPAERHRPRVAPHSQSPARQPAARSNPASCAARANPASCRPAARSNPASCTPRAHPASCDSSILRPKIQSGFLRPPASHRYSRRLRTDKSV